MFPKKQMGYLFKFKLKTVKAIFFRILEGAVS